MSKRVTEKASVASADPEARLRRHIQHLLEARGVVKRRFGEVAGRGPAWVTAYLKGDRRFPLDRLDQVAAFFGITPEALLQGINEPSDDRVTSQSASQLKKIVRFATEPRRRELICRIWSRPPTWLNDRVEVPTNASRMHLGPHELVGLGPRDYCPALADKFITSFQTAWDTGGVFEAYFNAEVGERGGWRVAVYERRGGYLVQEVYAVPRTVIDRIRGNDEETVTMQDAVAT